MSQQEEIDHNKSPSSPTSPKKNTPSTPKGSMLRRFFDPLFKPLKKTFSKEELPTSPTSPIVEEIQVKKSDPIPIKSKNLPVNFEALEKPKEKHIIPKSDDKTTQRLLSSSEILGKGKKKKILTIPSRASKSNPHDNEENNLIVREGDIIANRYIAVKLIGKGVYGIVLQCIDTKRPKQKKGKSLEHVSLALGVSKSPDFKNGKFTKENYEEVAVKIIKNHPDFHRQAKIEVEILRDINARYDPNEYRFVKLYDVFSFLNHLCITFELLGKNLFEMIQDGKYNGISIDKVARITKDILQCLLGLWDCNVVHCDLKPENVLLEKNIKIEEDVHLKEKEPLVKVIDFGSATYEHLTTALYIQSRFYRAPEVLLGNEYDPKIDMWSLGCITAEIFLGLPLFPGCCSYDQMYRIVKFLGVPSSSLIETGRSSLKYFELILDEKKGNIKYELKSEEKYCFETGDLIKGSKNYFSKDFDNINDLILSKDYNFELSKEEKKNEKNKRLAMINFLEGVIKFNPMKRWTPLQALKHPFLTGEVFPFSSGKKWKPSLYTRSSRYNNNSSSRFQQRDHNRAYGISFGGYRTTTNSGNNNKNISIQNNSYYDKPILGMSPNASVGSFLNLGQSNPSFSPFGSPTAYDSSQNSLGNVISSHFFPLSPSDYSRMPKMRRRSGGKDMQKVKEKSRIVFDKKRSSRGKKISYMMGTSYDSTGSLNSLGIINGHNFFPQMDYRIPKMRKRSGGKDMLQKKEKSRLVFDKRSRRGSNRKDYSHRMEKMFEGKRKTKSLGDINGEKGRRHSFKSKTKKNEGEKKKGNGELRKGRRHSFKKKKIGEDLLILHQ